ncbi:MAG: AzlD domain-containing protein [Rubrivivax sp.]|nr:AzlD domain-containing protein [Rubrivivax sp.]
MTTATIELTPGVLATLAGLGAVTFLTRGFFLLPQREWPLPRWLRKGLRYAPLAALTAVVAPEVVMTQGQLIHTWQDARLFSAAAGAAWYAWRRDILGTIAVGMAVMVPLRLGLGW